MTSHHFGESHREGRDAHAWRDFIFTTVAIPPSPGRGAHRAVDKPPYSVDFGIGERHTYRLNETTHKLSRSSLVGK